MITERPKQDRSTSILLWFLLSLAIFSLFFNLGGRSLENQDNMRFAEVAREILETGDWVMMRLGGDVYVDKPPLHFWNIALAYRLFGVGPFAARFPSAFFAMLGVLGIVLFSSRIQGENRKTIIYAALFLVSNYAYTYYSRTARMDMEYSVLFSLSLISFYMGYETGTRKHKILAYVLFWVFLGMAFLEKGPVAFIPLLIVLIYQLIRRDRRRLSFGILAATFPALIVTIVPWIVPLSVHKEFDTYLQLVRTQNIMTRRAGFFYYVPASLANIFPASVFVTLSLPFLWRWRDEFKSRPVLVFCLTWFAAYFFIIHLTVAKNIRYLLPAFVPLSVIAAWGTERIFSTGILKHDLRRHWKVAAGILAGLVCFAPVLWITVYKGFVWRAVLLSVVGISSLLFVWKRSRDLVIFTCALCLLSFLSVDLIRSAFNSKVSNDFLLYTLLRDHGVQADAVLLYKTGPDLTWRLGFYYNKLLRRKDNTLDVRDRTKTIVTTPEAVDEVFMVGGSDQEVSVIRNRDGDDKPNQDYYVVFPAPQ